MKRLRGVLCVATEDEADARSPAMAWAEMTIDSSRWPLPPNLLPLHLLDAQSFACVVASNDTGPALDNEGHVVRWHIGLELDRGDNQAALLDRDCLQYAQSLHEELEARPIGLKRMLAEISPAYEVNYLDQEKRPRDFVLRPVRLACQNVVMGLAAFQHDAAIDAMAVLAWQTCELPHVVTHEGNRALAALMLCDTFQSGGTMEIRFDRPAKLVASGITKRGGQLVDVAASYQSHPEGGQVPASLRRYGRVVGVALGADNANAISPREARELFKAVTPMPAGLRTRVDDVVARGIASPERLCFTLLAQIWREIELDFMLAVSARTASIISGGADWRQRADRQAESDVARAACMLGMLFRRLDTTDHAAAGKAASAGAARVVEDERVGVNWRVLGEVGAVVFRDLVPGRLPWQAVDSQHEIGDSAELVVIPRTFIDAPDLDLARQLATSFTHVALVVPQDAEPPLRPLDSSVAVLRCPDRLSEIDRVIERKLLDARLARA